MNTIDELLTRGRQVTDRYIKKKGEWCLNMQMLKIYEEVGELQRTNKPREALDEGSDVIYAVLTFWHLARFDDESIKDALERTMQKIEKRSVNVMEKQ